MDKEKRKQLESKGWKVGDTSDFLEAELPKEIAEKLTAQMEEARLHPEKLVSSESRRKRNG